MSESYQTGQPIIYSPAAWPSGAPPVTGLVASVREKPPAYGFGFRIAPGTTSSQLLAGNQSYPCRRIVLFAPGAGSFAANLLSVFFAVIPSGGGSIGVAAANTGELPPGAAATITIDNVNKLYLIAQNLVDVVTGWVEGES